MLAAISVETTKFNSIQFNFVCIVPNHNIHCLKALYKVRSRQGKAPCGCTLTCYIKALLDIEDDTKPVGLQSRFACQSECVRHCVGN